LENEVLKERYGSQLGTIVGIICLNGIFQESINTVIDTDDLSSYVQLVASNIESNNQSLMEVIQMFLVGGFSAVPLMASVYEVDGDLLGSFCSILLGE
jgi:hypothetical protein